MFDARSHKSQLIVTAVIASLTTATIISAYDAYTKKKRRKLLEQDIRRSLASNASRHDVARALESVVSEEPKFIYRPPDNFEYEYDEDLVREQLARNYAFFGEEGMSKIRKGTVVIVGCGGVGSWAAVMLVRS